MNILIAFDKFKDALTASEACGLACKALSQAKSDWTLDPAPLTDGGEGFSEILTLAEAGVMESAIVKGPRGESVQAKFGWVPLSKIPQAAWQLLDLPELSSMDDKRIAVVEMASASGLALLPEAMRDPWQTTSFGTGQLLRAAADAGACAIVLGVGGSATNDLGLGALAALGIRFSSTTEESLSSILQPGLEQIDHSSLPPVPAVWERIDQIVGAVLPALPPIRIACDVANPLLGSRGCTAVYGPQKGLRPADFERMERAVSAMAARLCNHFGREASFMQFPGNGAAGGIPFGLGCATPTRLMPGIDFVSAWLDLDARIARADIVITGEGSFDASSLDGKGPGAIASRALQLGKKVHVFAGKVSAPPRPGLELHAITPPGMPLPEALASAPRLLGETLRRAFTAGS